MVDETIVNEIVIQGADQVKSDLDSIGDAGEKAFGRLQNSLAGLDDPSVGRNALGQFTKLKPAIDDVTSAFGNFTKGTVTSRASLVQFLPQATATQNIFQKMGGAFTSVLAGMSGTARATKAAGTEFEGTGRSASAFGTTLRLLGRATGEPQLAQLGRTVGVLGRTFEIALPVIVVTILERMAASATKAAGNFADLAGSLRISVAQLGPLQTLATSAGVADDKLASSLKGVQTLIKATADNNTAAATAQRQFTQQIADSADTITQSLRGYDDLKIKQHDLLKGMLDGKTTLDDFIKGQRDLDKESRNLTEQIGKQEEAQRRIEEEHKAATAAADANATALQKLGIEVVASNGKLKTAPGVLLEISNALKQLGPGLQRDSVEFDLLAAGLDRKLLPALRQGADAFQRIEAEGAKIKPAFTAQDVVVADAFATAASQAGDAITAIIQQAGIAVAPAFTEFFIEVRDLLEQIRPGLVEFARTVGSIVGPILTGLAVAVREVFVPAFKLMIDVFQVIADLINSVFGTNVSAIQVFTILVIGLGIAFGGVVTAAILLTATIGLLIKALQDSGFSFSAVKQFALDAWTSITDGFNALVQLFVDGFNGTVANFASNWNAIVGFATLAWDLIKGATSSGIDFMVDKWNAFKAKVADIWSSIRQDIQDKVDAIKRMVPDFLGGGTDAGQQALAGGGPVRGPGTGTSDSVLLWGSTGEYMVRASAVNKYGLDFMHAINSLQLPRGVLDSLKGFAQGGLVTAANLLGPIPGFAAGGLVSAGALAAVAQGAKSGGRPLVLQIDGESFNGMTADQNAVDRLQRFASKKQIASAGVKPSWFFK